MILMCRCLVSSFSCIDGRFWRIRISDESRCTTWRCWFVHSSASYRMFLRARESCWDRIFCSCSSSSAAASDVSSGTGPASKTTLASDKCRRAVSASAPPANASAASARLRLAGWQSPRSARRSGRRPPRSVFPGSGPDVHWSGSNFQCLLL